MKHLKRILSVVLVVLMVFSCCSTALAGEVQPEEKKYPIVYVTGFGTTLLYYEDDPEKKSLFYPIDTDRILGNLGNIGDYIMTSILNRQPDILYTVLYEFLMDSVGMLALTDDGKSSTNGVTIDPLSLNFEESGGGKYAFHYDFRLNPYDVLPRLREHIAMVKEETGAEKVELVASSNGATVMMTYLEEYKDDLDDLDSVLLCVPTLGGIDILSEVMCDELYVDPLALQDFVSNKLGTEGIGLYLSILNKAGILDLLVQALFVPVLREAVLDALVDFARDCIATMPAAWTCVRDEKFDKALTTMFGENYADADHKNAVLIEGAQKFRENIMLRQNEIIDQTIANYPDMHFAVISKYGSAPIPIGSDGDKMNDGLVTLESSSFGATCGLNAQSLPEDYTQALYPEYDFISPDGWLDVSTCQLPFTTWYLKGLGHMKQNDGYWALINKIVHRNLDVFTDPETPQFQEVPEDDPQALVPMKELERTEETSILEDLIALIKLIFTKILEPIRKLFGKAETATLFARFR